MNKIILSLSTVPNRLLDPNENAGTKVGLPTLLKQTYDNYEIHFNIPYKYNIDNESIELPNWLIDLQYQYSDKLKIYRCDDLGPITKIIPTIERISDPDTVIISVDDDLYYMDGMIKGHIEARSRYPDYAIGFAGISAIDGSCHFCTSLSKDTKVKILEGYKSISYKRSFFDRELYSFIYKSWNDDYVLSAYLGYKNIPKIVISDVNETDFTPRVESFPVVGHTPIERGGCFNFRNSESLQEVSENSIREWYRLGYLER